MTDTHAGNGGMKVIDQLLIDISTGDSSVVGSQSSARDNIQTIDSRKSVPRKRLMSETTAKTTTNRSASSTAKGQLVDVLKGLNELNDLQRQSLSSMNQMISTMTSAVETFTQARTSRKRKRDEMSGSDSSDQEDPSDPGMAGNSLGDITNQVNDLLQSTESSKNCSKANEDEVLGELSKLYESEGTVSDPINAKLASLIDKMVKTSLSEEKIKEKHAKYNRPENCENLINTRVNPEIWSKVRSNTRS